MTDGESGTKLIRCSMATLLRDRLAVSDWLEIEMFFGHTRFDQTSDIYAPFAPNYLAKAREIEAIVDEVEALAPGGVLPRIYRARRDVVPIRRAARH